MQQNLTRRQNEVSTACGSGRDFGETKTMSRIIKAGLIQSHNVASTDASIDEIKKANLDHQMRFVEDAARQGVQVLCFQ